MRDIINELFVKMSRLVTQYDKFKRFIPFKYRRFILYIAIFTVIIYTMSELTRKDGAFPNVHRLFFLESNNCPERAKHLFYVFTLIYNPTKKQASLSLYGLPVHFFL